MTDIELNADVIAAVKAEARDEVKRAVEEWFTDVALDDLFAAKGWTAQREVASRPLLITDLLPRGDEGVTP